MKWLEGLIVIVGAASLAAIATAVYIAMQAPKPNPPVPIEVKMLDELVRIRKAVEAKSHVEPSAMRLPDVQRGLEVLTSAETIDIGKIKLGGDSSR